jgi:hypothetical protein
MPFFVSGVERWSKPYLACVDALIKMGASKTL